MKQIRKTLSLLLAIIIRKERFMNIKINLFKSFAFGLFMVIALAAFFGCAKSNGEDPDSLVAEEDNKFFISGEAARIGDRFYFMEESDLSVTPLIFVADIASGEVMPLCAKPDCNHDSKECSAYLYTGFVPGFYANGGRLYAVEGEGRAAKLISMSYDGSDRKTELALDQEAEGEVNGGYSITSVWRGKLIRCGMSYGIEEGMPHNSAAIYTQEIKSESEPKTVLKVENVEEAPACVSGDKLYLAAFSGSETAEVTIYAFDQDTEKAEELYKGPVPELASKITVINGEIVFSWGKAVYAFSLENRTFRTIYASPESKTMYIGDGVIIEGLEMTKMRFVGFDGSTVSECEIDPALFHEDRWTRRFLGYAEGSFYYVFSSWGGKKLYNYLVEFDVEDNECRVLWEKEGRTEG